VLPAVTNGVMTVAVRLDDPAAPELRPNMRVDVWLVTGTSEHDPHPEARAFATSGAG
jgi:hypothetical protein